MCLPEDNTLVLASGRANIPRKVLEHVVDVHCHPTDSPCPEWVMADLSVRACAMATRASDQQLVRDLAVAYPGKIIPCFGYHPWFAHWVSVNPDATKEEHYRSLFLDSPAPSPATVEALDTLIPLLPDPILLTDVLVELRDNLTRFPEAMLGEVGLDRICRIPYLPPSPPPYALHDGPRALSPFTIPLSHQLVILEAQIDLAVELRRNVSLHSVKSQEATVKLFNRMKDKYKDKWTDISVDLHSCGLSVPSLRDIQRKHTNVFMSLSTVINSRSPTHRDLIAACLDDRLLAESDYNSPGALERQTWDMVLRIADVKGWTVESEWLEEVPREEWGVVRRLEHNWVAFRAGGHPKSKSDAPKTSRKERQSLNTPGNVA